MTVSNIHKLQKALESQNFSDLPPELTSRTLGNDGTANEIDENDCRINKLPVIDSFFPFSSNIENSEELAELLIASHELLNEVSLFDQNSLEMKE